MKKIFLFLLTATLCSGLFAQDKTPPFKRFPNIPPFQLLQSDSSTVFTRENLKKNKPTMILVFSPTCEHCQHEIREMIQHKADFQQWQVLMVTMAPIYEMKAFISEYGVNQLPDVQVGRDTKYVFAPFFQMHNFPFMGFYDAGQHLIKVHEGNLPMEEMKAILLN